MDPQEILDIVEEKNMSIKDINIMDIIPNSIEDVIINVDETNKCCLWLSGGMGGEKYSFWKKGRGGVFYKDLKKSLTNEPHGNYVLLEGEGKVIIARLIEDEELETFDLLKLIDGKIKDKAYMRLQYIESEKSLKSNRYIDKTDELMDSDPKIVINQTDISSEPEDSDNQGNVSLFKD